MPKEQLLFEEDFPPHEFRDWQKNVGLNAAAIARLFKVKPQTVGRWRDRGAPMLVRWACMAWGMGYRPPGVDAIIKPPRKKRNARPPGNPSFKRKAP